MPGSIGYDPTMPWIRKVREDGCIVTDLHVYVDDVRITGATQESVWKAGSRVAKLCSFYGLQDAPRKLREPSREPGAWAGSVVATVDGVVTKFVTKERWRKTQGYIRWLAKKIGVMGDQWSNEIPDDEDAKASPTGCLPHKQAERIRGFLIYVSRTYKSMVPYLKGLHLTLDFWRPDRDEEGWRGKQNLDPEEASAFSIGNNKKAPRFVKIAPRLKADVQVRSHELNCVPRGTSHQCTGKMHCCSLFSGRCVGVGIWRLSMGGRRRRFGHSLWFLGWKLVGAIVKFQGRVQLGFKVGGLVGIWKG
jgi:hypothetical protein